MADNKAQEAAQQGSKQVDIEAAEASAQADERQPLVSNPSYASEAGPSAPYPASAADRPRTVRHHRRTLSGRSVRSGHFQFGPSFQSQVYPAVNDPFTRQAKRAADARARSRFIKALALGFGLWILIGLLLGWSGFQELSGRNRLDYGSKPAVPPSEGTPFNCANFSETAHPKSRVPRGYEASTATFDIPLSTTDLFFVRGQGSFAKGRIHISVQDGDSTKAKVVVEARYNDPRLVNLMQVCQVRKEESDDYGASRDIGLGIYTPTPVVGPYPDSDLDFDVVVQLPRHLQRLYALQVRGKLFAVEAGDLTDLALNLVDFESTNSRIAFKSVRAHAIRGRTSNGAIYGHFNVSKTLTLASTNGAITAQVALFPRSSVDDDLPKLPPNPPAQGDDLRMQKKPADDEDKGTSVHATTTNGAVEVEYVQHPLGQTLFSYAASTNGRVKVTHPAEFEGTFEAETTWGSASVTGPDTIEDPSGRGRERVKEISKDQTELGHRLIMGTIWWSEKGKDDDRKSRGDTLVKTTLGSARIDFS